MPPSPNVEGNKAPTTAATAATAAAAAISPASIGEEQEIGPKTTARVTNTKKAREKITVEVPPGFQPMSLPVEEENRIPADEIVLERIRTVEDLMDVAKGLHTSFPSSWWNNHEPLSQRPPPQEREHRFASRYNPIWLTYPHYHALKAVHRPTNTFVGFAGWMSPQHTCLPIEASETGEGEGGAGGNMFLRSTARGLGFGDDDGDGDADGQAEKEEKEKAWESIREESWEKEFRFYDGIRKVEMQGRPHWYLAPLFVVESWRGRGVGGKLMEYAIQRAEEEGSWCYLEAFPNARPVYGRYGFLAAWEVEGDGRSDGRTEEERRKGREMVMIRPPSKLVEEK